MWRDRRKHLLEVGVEVSVGVDVRVEVSDGVGVGVTVRVGLEVRFRVEVRDGVVMNVGDGVGTKYKKIRVTARKYLGWGEHRVPGMG